LSIGQFARLGILAREQIVSSHPLDVSIFAEVHSIPLLRLNCRIGQRQEGRQFVWRRIANDEWQGGLSKSVSRFHSWHELWLCLKGCDQNDGKAHRLDSAQKVSIYVL
jgi:hypothetical protein